MMTDKQRQVPFVAPAVTKQRVREIHSAAEAPLPEPPDKGAFLDGDSVSLPDGSTIAVVRLGDLRVPSYQRTDKNVGSYKKIRNEFDIRLYDVLTLSKRADGKLWVIDGLQRLTARRDLEGPETLAFGRVLSDLDVAQEVELFVRLNRNRTKVGSYDLIKAQREAGEPQAVDLFRVVESVGFTDGGHLSLSQTHGARSVGTPDYLMTVMKWPEGAFILRAALVTARDAWGTQHGTFHGSVVGGLATVYKWAREQDVRIRPAEFSAKLREGKYAKTAKEIMSVAGAISAKAGGADMTGATLAHVWNQQRRTGRIEISDALKPFLRTQGYK